MDPTAGASKRKYAGLGPQCSAFGCNKRKKKKNGERSDSDGDPDEETPIKRQFPRTFHS